MEGARQVKRQLNHYSLPLILAVGFRARSKRGTQVRQWANERLSEYLVKCFAMDDQPSDSETQKMFQTVQNKLHFAVTGLTAPEIIAKRVNPEPPSMGLVGMFLDYAEDQAQRRKQVFLKDWPERLDAFLSFNDRDVLPGLGSISREAAEQQAFAAYDQFHERRRLVAEDQGAIDAMAALENAARLVERRGVDQEKQP